MTMMAWMLKLADSLAVRRRVRREQLALAELRPDQLRDLGLADRVTVRWSQRADVDPRWGGPLRSGGVRW
jgi:hypothetical protein